MFRPRYHFPTDHLLKRLPLADEVGGAVLEEDFGGEGFAVVVAAHDRAVRAGAADDEVVADGRFWQRAAAYEAAFFLCKNVA